MIQADQTKRILTLTLNPAIDVNTSVEAVRAERKLRCTEPTREAGGGGINVARAIRNLGGTAAAVVAAGGRAGERLVELLESESVPVESIPISGETRENVNVYEDVSTLQYRFIMPGPQFEEEDCERVLETFRSLEKSADFVVVSGSLPRGVSPTFYRRLARDLHKQGTRLIVDTSGDALRETLGPGVFLIKPNIDEFRSLIGDEKAGDPQVEAAARRIIDEGGCNAVLVSLGSGGAMLVHGEGIERIAAPTVRIESKVGAGDSTVAGVVLALARGMELVDAARFGVASGAAAVMTPGTELCRRQDAERLFVSMKR